jgi:Na+/phosphate symporter
MRFSDGNIIESVISDTSEDSQTDDDDDIEEVQPTCKQVTDSLNIAIKFFKNSDNTYTIN